MILPRLESFATPAIAKAASTPKRFLALYVGHGFAVTRHDEHPNSDLSWYPKVIEDKLMFGPSMAAMQPFADKGKVSVFRGLEHPQVARINGHSSADSFLSSGDLVAYRARSAAPSRASRSLSRAASSAVTVTSISCPGILPLGFSGGGLRFRAGGALAFWVLPGRRF